MRVPRSPSGGRGVVRVLLRHAPGHRGRGGRPDAAGEGVISAASKFRRVPERSDATRVGKRPIQEVVAEGPPSAGAWPGGKYFHRSMPFRPATNIEGPRQVRERAAQDCQMTRPWTSQVHGRPPDFFHELNDGPGASARSRTDASDVSNLKGPVRLAEVRVDHRQSELQGLFGRVSARRPPAGSRFGKALTSRPRNELTTSVGHQFELLPVHGLSD